MDRRLVEQAMAGDRSAFDELARASINRMFGLASLILRDSDRASDATQEALVAAWRDLSALRDPDRFDGWLHRLLLRACYREASQGRRRWTVETEVREWDGMAPDPTGDFADRDQLERGFRRLAPEQRAVIVLHHYLGLTLDETADALGVPPGTARSRINRAMGALRAALDAVARSVNSNERRLA